MEGEDLDILDMDNKPRHHQRIMISMGIILLLHLQQD
jgi:hypothetical protein